MMKLALPLVLSLALLAPAAKAQDGCGSYPQIPVKVVSVFEEPNYDFTQDINGLQAIASRTKDKIPGNHKSLALGLTTYTPLINFKAKLVEMPTTSGLPCIMVEDIFASLGYQDIKVYIATEFPQGTCGFDAIVEHEVKHLIVNKEVLEEYVEKIRTELEYQMPILGVAQQESIAYSEQVLRREINAIVSKFLNEMSQENARRQMEIDSEEEYERVSNACEGEIQNAMKAHLKQARQNIQNATE